MAKNLKKYRSKELLYYIVANLLLISIYSGLYKPLLDISNDNLSNVLISVFNSTIVLSIIYIYVFLFDSIISYKLKDRIIWLIGGLPGETIFTKIAIKNVDIRFNTQQALRIYEDIYKSIKIAVTPKDKRLLENNAWYKIYKKYENEPIIFNSHRDYLLCRDMFSITFLIIIGYGCILFYQHTSSSWHLIILFFVELLLSWIAARNKGKIFVYNVIAHDISANDKSNIMQL